MLNLLHSVCQLNIDVVLSFFSTRFSNFFLKIKADGEKYERKKIIIRFFFFCSFRILRNKNHFEMKLLANVLVLKVTNIVK